MREFGGTTYRIDGGSGSKERFNTPSVHAGSLRLESPDNEGLSK